MTMRFSFTKDQIEFAETVRDVLADRCPPAAVRSAWNGDGRSSSTLWQSLADLGLLGALVPPDQGGLGLDELDILLCMQESGRAAAAVPLVETVVVAARLLAGSPPGEWLPALATGRRRISATLDGSNLLPWAGFCDWAMVGHGAAVYLVPVPEGEPVPAVDRARPLVRLAALSTDGPPATAYLVTDDPARIASARRAGTLATAAQLIGLAERMLAMTVDYVKERRQFGVPIGSFQAVKHALADALLALELARPLVYAAAWAHVHDAAGAERDVAGAKIRAGEAAGLVARTALQCHGGMGYTQEHDLHLWLKRTWALQASWGQAGELRAHVASSLGLTGAGPTGAGPTGGRGGRTESGGTP
jgi:alkylation response protein AidB-like acyl-CoA dehydrogenase